MKNAARVRVSYELLAAALLLPDGAEIECVMSHDDLKGEIEFVIKHSSLPSVRPGELYRKAIAEYSTSKFEFPVFNGFKITE